MKTLSEITIAVQQGRTQPALEALSRLVQERLPEQQELRNAVITLLARHNQLQSRRIMGIVAEGEAQITQNQITYGTLEMIELLREELNGREAPQPGAVQGADHRIKILFFAANPTGTAPLNLGKEVREIEDALKRSNFRDRFELIQAHATRPKDFMRRILEEQPQFVHFAGHGAQAGLYMLDDDDRAVLIPAKPLAEIFKLFGKVIGCVVLNACYSEAQAQEIREHIPHVIGTTQALPDSDAIAFAAMFYTAVGEGKDIDFAFQFAKLGHEVEGGEDGVFVMR